MQKILPDNDLRISGQRMFRPRTARGWRGLPEPHPRSRSGNAQVAPAGERHDYGRERHAVCRSSANVPPPKGEQTGGVAPPSAQDFFVGDR